MTYIRIEHFHTGDERWIKAGPDAFAVHVAALVYCDQQLTDGRIAPEMALRVSLAVPQRRAKSAVSALLLVGFWIRDGDFYVIQDYESYAFPAEQIRRSRLRWATDKTRRIQHKIGDHGLCKDPKFCPAVRSGSTVETQVDSVADSTVETGVDARVASPMAAHAYTHSKPNSIKPNQTRPGGSGVGVGAGSNSHAATPSDPRDPHRWEDDGSGISCALCGLPATHKRHEMKPS